MYNVGKNFKVLLVASVRDRTEIAANHIEMYECKATTVHLAHKWRPILATKHWMDLVIMYVQRQADICINIAPKNEVDTKMKIEYPFMLLKQLMFCNFSW